MDTYSHKLNAAHAIKARKIGKGNESLGVRIALERFNLDEEKKERRINDKDRRKLIMDF